MTVIEKLLSWLSACPYLAGREISVNHTDEIPGSVGLYPQGCQEMSVREDVLGNRTVTCRERYLLYQVTEDAKQSGEMLMALQNWVREQSFRKQIPQFGDLPGQEWIRAEKGKLTSVSGLGTGKHTLEITIEYEKHFEGSM